MSSSPIKGRTTSNGPWLTIHRGAHEIGGSCIEIATRSTRVLFDLGAPLEAPSDTDASNLLPPVPGLRGDDEPAPDAIVISHAHQDHYGLCHLAAPTIPHYCTPATRDLIELTGLISGQAAPPAGEVRSFTPGRTFAIGDIRITPLLADHSAFDACSFVIYAAGRTVIYSGDFRRHGRKPGCWDAFVSRAPRQADALLLEGTTLGREAATPRTEHWLEDRAAELMKQSNGPFLFTCSGQNIDRLVSFYRAARRNGRLFVVDVYTANVLTMLAAHCPSIPHPGRFPGIAVIFPRRLTDRLVRSDHADLVWRMRPWKITREEIAASARRIAMLARPSVTPMIAATPQLSAGTYCYSLWRGYRNEPTTQRLIRVLSDRGFAIHDLHVSGHADPETLRQTVQRLQPRQIVPIHTEHAEAYATTFDRPVRRLADGERWEVG